MNKYRRARFLETLDKYRIITNENECYAWSGRIKNKKRPPRIFVYGETIWAHRAAWMVSHGKIPKNQYVRHKCKNVACTNPAHLYLSEERGTRKKPEERKSKRLGRERLSVDLPRTLVEYIRKTAKKYNVTITKYIFKRLSEVVEYEKKIDKKLEK